MCCVLCAVCCVLCVVCCVLCVVCCVLFVVCCVLCVAAVAAYICVCVYASECMHVYACALLLATARQCLRGDDTMAIIMFVVVDADGTLTGDAAGRMEMVRTSLCAVCGVLCAVC